MSFMSFMFVPIGLSVMWPADSAATHAKGHQREERPRFVAGKAVARFALAMPIKTKEGWKSRKQIEAQGKAWKKARSTLMEKLGPAVDDPSLLSAKAETLFKEFDLDGNGKIDAAEVKQTFSKAGIELKAKEVAEMIKEADEDG